MHWKEEEGSPAASSWTEGEERAREAIERWRAAPGPACMLHGPPGAGKTALCTRLVAEAGERTGVCAAAVQIGRASRFVSEQEILASLLEQLGEDVLHPPRDVLKLRSDLRNRLANGQDEDEPEVLLVLDGLDECVDWPRDAGVSTLREFGKRVRCVVSIAGGEGDAHAWRERLGWKDCDVRLVEVAPPSPAAAEARGIPSWAAAGGNGGPEVLVAEVERELRLLERGAVALEVLSMLARALAPLEPEDVAELLEIDHLAALDLLRGCVPSLGRLLRWDEPMGAVRFQHEALRVAWEQRSAGRDEAEAVEARYRGAIARCTAEPSRCRAIYIRRQASAHLALGGAPVTSMLAFAEPGWVEAVSAEALADVLLDLRRLRDRIEEEVERCRSLTPPLAAALVRCAAAQGAAATLGDAEPWASPDADLVTPRLDADAARALSLLALAAEVSLSARAGVLERAFEIADRTGARWSSPSALIGVAEAAEGERRTRYARAALEAARRSDGEDAVRGLVAAAGLLPEEEAQEVAAEAIARAGGAAPALVPGPGVSEASAVALERASRALAAPQRIRVLARLLSGLPAEARARAVQEIERLWAPWCFENKEEAEAVAPYLSEPLLERALEEVPIWPVHALGARLVSVGREDEARALVLRWAGSSAGYRADALLRLGEAFPPGRRPEEEVQALFEELAPEERCRLIKEHPSASVALLGEEAVLRIAEGCVEPSASHVRIGALARLAGTLPAPMRAEAARRAVLAFEAGGHDADALGDLCEAAPWMSPADAARLLSTSLLDASGIPSLAGVFQGWASVAQLAGVFRRAGGEEAVLAAAEEVAFAGRWLHGVE
ncbi:ATP-binding protein [Sorangium sp. So ce1151]|uniref:ATP-binding protein n=1 Tax=Sorangium sp. So ce1151 TaxID=3133332 RepID=UPI003F63FB48